MLTKQRQSPSAKMGAVTSPILVVVSGPPGSGKTTLAHHLAGAIGCPAICRDEIKEGMVVTTRHFVPALGDPLTERTFRLFFAMLGLLLEGGVTVVGEAAFQHEVWQANLDPLASLARLRIVQCHADLDTARRRVMDRGTSRRAHADEGVAAETRYFEGFQRLSLPQPSITVDTTSGYDPSIDEVVHFILSTEPMRPPRSGEP